MWLQVSLLCLAFLTLLPHGRAQKHASLDRSVDAAGRCLYTFTAAGPEQSGCSGPGGQPQSDGVLARLTLLEALVGPGGVSLPDAYSRAVRERDRLLGEKETLTRRLGELRDTVAELSREAEGLRRRGACRQNDTSGPTGHENTPAADAFDNGTYQEMKAEVTEVAASHFIPDGNRSLSGCGELLAVGEPELHRTADAITGKYGVWLQDPEPPEAPDSPESPVPLYTNQTVWRIDAVGTDLRRLFAYEDLEQFSRGFPMKVLLLPEPLESTGAALYRGSLYYQRRRSRTLIRYRLAAESLAARRDLPGAGFHGQHPYSWGGYTDIDLAADERGLWAIYSTAEAKGAIVISRLDPESLEVRRSWETGVRKSAVANAFMLCGRLYTLASYTAPNTTLNYVFDTASGAGRAAAVPFANKYGYNSMVDYNHARRKLYAWDNFHMVTYDVTLSS
ncbi:myocilin-like [Menidia menidia]